MLIVHSLVQYVMLLIFVQHVQAVVIEMSFSEDKVFRYNKMFAPCEGPRRASYHTNVSISSTDRHKFNYDFVATKSFIPDEIRFNFSKCPSEEALASCSFLKTLRTRKPCDIFPRPKEVYSPMIACSTPKWICPFRKGVYRGRNCWMDFRKFNWFPVGSVYWKVRIEMYERRREVYCGYFEGSVIRRG